MLTQFYPHVKHIHITAIAFSFGVFLVRALLLQIKRPWAHIRFLRYSSYVIDTVLLVSAVVLMLLISQYPLVHTWLTVKVGLVLLYIVLGSFALKRSRTRARQFSFAVLALLTFGAIYLIARYHSAWGPWWWLKSLLS